MSRPLPGARSVVATLDESDGVDHGEDTAATACVVACPPHPQHSGNRSDGRLVAVGEALTNRGIDCLRFDYGEWDDGYGEREDARNAIRWADDRYDRVGVFGYSFGGAMAILAAGSVDSEVQAISTLAPAPRLAADLDAVDAVGDLDRPIQVVFGERDDTVDVTPLVEAVRAVEDDRTDIHAFGADHFFVGQRDRIGDLVATFQSRWLFPA